MKFRFNIGRKIGFGFGALIILTLVVFFTTNNTLRTSRVINEQNISVNTPSVDALQELKIMILNSKLLISTWTVIQGAPDHPEKQNLVTLQKKTYPQLKSRILELANNWKEEEKAISNTIFEEIDKLFILHKRIQETLITFESYEDPLNKFEANSMLEDGGEIDFQTDKIILHLDNLMQKQRFNSSKGIERMNDSFDALHNIVKYLGFLLVLGGILIAFFTVRAIVKPVQQLRKLLLLLGKGIIPNERIHPTADEIGDMSLALNDLVEGFMRTNEFAKQVGAGNFTSEYQPLSKEDTLGHSLLAMRKDLFELTSNLEQKVLERTATIEAQKGEIEVLLKHVTDSIRYAKRIQEAILPPVNYVKSALPNAFILYKPKDIVSGDFYWVHKRNGKTAVAAVDCTGHGVPGAFMTIIGHNGLQSALVSAKELEPSAILNSLDEFVSATFSQKDGNTTIKDGMDISLCTIDYENKKVQYAGAFNPLWMVRNGEFIEIKANKFPIGAFVAEHKHKFTNNKFDVEPGDTIYIFSDGYADQFGGPKGKKFMYRPFKDLLMSIQKKSMEEQKIILNSVIEDWRGDHEQVDDMIVIGIRFD